MPLRDLQQKSDKLNATASSVSAAEQRHVAPEFTFMRSDTHSQEIVSPPDFETSASPHFISSGTRDAHHRFASLLKPRPRASTTASPASLTSNSTHVERSSSTRRISERIGLRKVTSSSNLPKDLPNIDTTHLADGDVEKQWEQRATLLAVENERHRSRSNSPAANDRRNMTQASPLRFPSQGVILTGKPDDDIQEAIRLHEAGNLEEATSMFGRLADPNRANNALSQVLYGLALR